MYLLQGLRGQRLHLVVLLRLGDIRVDVGRVVLVQLVLGGRTIFPLLPHCWDGLRVIRCEPSALGVHIVP